LRDFVYFYIGAFAGGGIVLNGGSMSAQRAMPARSARCRCRGRTAGPVQLIDIASLAVLEKALNAAARMPPICGLRPRIGAANRPNSTKWLEGAGRGLAYAIVSAAAVIDFEAAIIDGWMPQAVRKQLVEATRSAMAAIDVEGLQVPAIREGTVGIHARALGGASLPLSERFLAGAANMNAGS
jgi:predicted NBD/HSP70 family sugar kinase